MIPDIIKNEEYNNITPIRKNNLFKLIFLHIIIIIALYKDINLTEKNISERYYEYNKTYEQCYISSSNSGNRIIHLIITRFMLDLIDKLGNKKLYKEDYILNGIRVMKQYLLPSLDNQSCKNFIWVLMLGNGANITYIKTLFNFNISFIYNIIYEKNIKNYIRNISKSYNILITTRIDYDDRIYYDAVNDVRKAININKPILLYGYNSGVYYFEINDKYYYYYRKIGVSSVFTSLVIILNKVNTIYNVYDLGSHIHIENNILNNYKKFGIKEINYKLSIFDNGDPKFVKVIQKYSETRNLVKSYIKGEKSKEFNINTLYGKTPLFKIN